MDQKIIEFDDTEIGEYKFHQHKSFISINHIDIIEIVVSNKLPFGENHLEYFIDLYAYSFQK